MTTKSNSNEPESHTRRRILGTVIAVPATLVLPVGVAQAVPSGGGVTATPILITPPSIRVWRAAQ